MQVVKNFLYNVSYQILILMLPLITVPYVSKVLGASGVGKYAFTFANTQYFILFGMIGITLYGNRQIAYVRDDKEKLKNTFYSIYLVQFTTLFISSMVFLLFVFAFNKGLERRLYLIQGINIIASLIDISWVFMGLEQFKKTVGRNTLVKLISLVSIFRFVRNSNDLEIYILIIALSTLIGNLTFWLYVPKTIGIKNIKISNLSLHFKASVKLFVPQIAMQVYTLLSKTLLGVFSNSSEVGYYENTQKIVKICLTVATALGTVMMPKISNTVAIGDMKKVKYYIYNSFFFMSFISIPLAFGLMGISKELSPWFFGKDFNGIYILIMISSISIIFVSWSNVLGTQLLVPLNKIRSFTISVTLGAIINFILNILLLKTTGKLGACITIVIAEFTVTICQFYFVREILKISKLLKSVLIFFPSAILMFIIIRMIGVNIGAGILTTITQTIVGGIFYIISVLALCKVFYKENLIIYIKKMITK